MKNQILSKICYADEETRNKVVVIDGDCIVFPVKEVYQDKDFIHLVIDENFINYIDI